MSFEIIINLIGIISCSTVVGLNLASHEPINALIFASLATINIACLALNIQRKRD